MRVIAGCAGGRLLKTRKGLETRPTADRVKESLFNIIGEKCSGSRFLDIFAGNGGIGIEALSRGAAKCVFIEKNNQCVKIIKENLELTGFSSHGRVFPLEAGAALSLLNRDGELFDIIFLDPPYRSPDLVSALSRIAQAGLLAPEGLLIVEHHSRDSSWRDKTWEVMKEKKYGDTGLTFLVPVSDEKTILSP